MRKVNFYLLVFACIISFSCKKDVTAKDYIKDVIITPTNVKADGATIIVIKAILNNDLDKRSVQFESDKGIFQDSDKPNMIKITAEKVKDTLVAVARLKVPATPGQITISVQPDITDLEGKFVVERTITTTVSEAISIDISANSFSVHNNFDGEIDITGVLKNFEGKGVSKGVKVELKDYDLSFNPLLGVFRNSSLSTNEDSKVSAIYTPGLVAANQYIYLIGTILNADGSKSNYSDTLKIFVTKKE